MRLFVAVNLPEHIKKTILSACEPLVSSDCPIRWVRPDGLHITMKFLGNVEGDRVTAIAEVLDTIASKARGFELSLEGFGAFPSSAAPKVIFTGCDHAPKLELLQHDLEIHMEAIGFASDGKPFRPHVTVGRARRNAKRATLREAGASLSDIEFADVAWVDSIELMKSRLDKGGARYESIHSARLGT